MFLVREPDTRPLAVDVVGHGGRVDKGLLVLLAFFCATVATPALGSINGAFSRVKIFEIL